MAVRLCSYNVEYFNKLFEKNNDPKTGKEEMARLDAIAAVISQIDPDLIGIIEAPNTCKTTTESTVAKLENFAQAAGLRVKKAIIGFVAPGTQELAVLYDPDKLTLTHTPGGKKGSKGNPPFDGDLYFDTDEDSIREVYKFARPPLEVEVTVKSNNNKFKLILAHTKSKGIFKPMDLVHWERENVRNRLKLYAECSWINNRVVDWRKAGDNVVVMGDINDGPGMDYYEMKFGRSAVETLMGDIFYPDYLLRNFIGRPKWTEKGWKPSSTKFRDKITEDYVRVLIDHILVSPGSIADGQTYRIWNPDENDVTKPLEDNLTKASDHFPVSLDLNL